MTRAETMAPRMLDLLQWLLSNAEPNRTEDGKATLHLPPEAVDALRRVVREAGGLA